MPYERALVGVRTDDEDMPSRPLKRRDRPGPGQESVWDYPRPPALEASSASILIEFGGQNLVRTSRSFRVLETSHPPVHYVAIADVTAGALRPNLNRNSFCEWKGAAAYFDVVLGDRTEVAAAWTYATPTRASPHWLSTSRSIRRTWTPAGWTVNGSKRRTEISTAAGVRRRWWARSRAARARGAGSQSTRP